MEPVVILIAAALVFPVLFFVPAPYGRHAREGFGPMMPARLGWFAMEVVSLISFCAALGEFHWLALLWILHYANRSFVFPLLMRGEAKRKPVLTVAMAIVFNVLNVPVQRTPFGTASAISLQRVTSA